MTERGKSGRATRTDGGGLRALFQRLDGQPYGHYRQLVGRHRLDSFEVWVDRVPPDPFAGSARMRLVADHGESSIPDDLVHDRWRRLGVEDYLCRETIRALEQQFGTRPRAASGTGHVGLEPIGPAVLERSGCRVTNERTELRLFVDLPAGGRRIRGRQAEALFQTVLLRLATSVLTFSSRRVAHARAAADRVEDHRALQAELQRRGLVAFVADGSLLARASGADPGPRRDGREVAFQSPDALRVTLDTPHAGPLTGMGVPAGVTVIVGGAFHGKSTLLDAVAAGIHPHHADDGRERVATLPEAVVIRAEDGRSVRRADISAFLGELPSGLVASEFTTQKASGSTSQAASIVESLELGARLLLLDEDRSATNLMVRDGRMQRLVPRPSEPIVPLLDRVRELYERRGVSTLLVTGGSGDYLEVADKVIRMDGYRPRDVTAEAREVVEMTRSTRLAEPIPAWEASAPRVPTLESGLDAARLRSALRGPRAVKVGDETVELQALEQLVEPAQVRALGRLLRAAARRMDAKKTLAELVRELDEWIDARGVDGLDPPVAYDLARPRVFELAAALNRWRALRICRPV